MLPPPPTQTVEPASGAMTLQQYVSIFLRRRYIFLYAFLLVFIGGIIFTLLQPPVYRASAKLLIDSRGPTINAVDSTNPLSALFAVNQTQSIDTEVEVLQSAPLRAIVNKEIGLQAYAITVSKVGNNTNVIQVVAEANTPQRAKDVPEVLIQAYLDMDRQNNLQELKEAHAFVDKQQKQAKAQHVKSQEALRQFQQKHGVLEYQKDRDALSLSVSATQAKLDEDAVKLQSAKAQIAYADKQLRTLPTTIATALPATNPARQAIAEEIRRLVVERQGLTQSGGLTAQNPKIIAIDAQLTTLRQQEKNTPETLSNVSSQLNTVREGFRTRLAELQTQQRAVEGEMASLRQQLQGQLNRLQSFPTYEIQMARLEQERDTAADSEKMLASKAVDLELREKAYRPSGHILEGSFLPGAPVRPRKLQNFIVFALFGMFTGVCLVLLQEYLDDRINTVEDTQRLSNLPSLGHVPLLSEADAKVLPLAQAANPALESYRILRTNINFASIDNPVKTLLVTSSNPGEGKTTTAVNLAFAMALDGRRVVLVDSDLRRPSLHRTLKVEASPGLTDLFVDTAELSDVLRPYDGIPNLFYVTAGAIPPNPSELLGSRKFQHLIEQLSETFDLVIVDSPPVLVAADAAILASELDGVVLVVEAGRTKKSHFKHTCSTLQQARAHILGITHNKIRSAHKEGYYYQYQYKYHYAALPDGSTESKASTNGFGHDEAGTELIASSPKNEQEP